MPSIDIIKYYRLFEVRILHEYFLLSADVPTYFDKSKAVREDILRQSIVYGQYKLNDAISIRPTALSLKKLDGYRWRFVPTSTGFLVAGEGKEIEGLANAFRPAFRIEDGMKLEFIIDVKDPAVKSYTNIPLKQLLPALYCFSNELGAESEPNNFLSLSRPAQPFQLGDSYTAGTLADFGVGGIRLALASTTDANDWLPVPGRGFANDSDQRLLPKALYYQLEAGVGTAEFRLLQTNGEELKKITFDNAAGSIKLDFSKTKFPAATEETATKDGWYILESSLDGNVQQRRVYLSSEYSQRSIGMVRIVFNSTAPGYELWGPNQEILNPVYEIRLLSRRTFWRYYPSLAGRKFRVLRQDVADLFDDVQVWDGDVANQYGELVTKVPQPLTALPIGVKNTAGDFAALPVALPSPLRMKTAAQLRAGESPGRLYSEVYTVSIKDKFDIK